MSGESPKTSVEQGVAPGQGYGGDVTADQAWEVLKESPDAVLVDVRTQPEWVFVGVPDLTDINKKTVFVPWQVFPAMQVNAEFVQQVKASGAKSDAPVLFLCRSGQRSRAAAIAMTSEGYGRCYNVAGGFEGPHGEDGHRGTKDGWKVKGLPWVQD
jgi:rhodanese-related sulfurtransferase